jgi:glycerol uptake facilitator-like aquaporin
MSHPALPAGGLTRTHRVLIDICSVALFAVGMGYAIGVILALVVVSGTSGGHINPCITIVMMLFHGFPVARGLR